MKKYIPLFALLVSTFLSAQTSTPKVGYYITKEDYLDKRLTFNPKETMIASPNYNLGIINYRDKDSNEHKFNCIREKYWGFRYLDGFDYVVMPNGFCAKIVIAGKRLDLLMSPKANFSSDSTGHYTFTAEEGKKINFFFVKNLDPSTEQPFEKQIEDEKLLLKEFQADRDNYREFINKQLKYLKKYNETLPATKKGKKK